jgi:hypothetical protein
VRARRAWVLAASVAPLSVAACELVAGVHQVTLAEGTGGMREPVVPDEGGTDATVDARADAHADAGADAAPPLVVPPGYGHYCSVTYPDGSWRFERPYALDDPCKDILTAFPGGVIQRAGLWSLAGTNSAFIQCAQSSGEYTGMGAEPMDKATGMVGPSAMGCIVTVAPGSLPILARPYGPSPGQTDPDADVDLEEFQGFNFDALHLPWNVVEFGQQQKPPGTDACDVDRLGEERCYFGSDATCASLGEDAGCMVRPLPPRAPQPNYRWFVSTDEKPILAVANGIVRAAQVRMISGCTSSDERQTVAIEHRVGSGTYEERFVSVYGTLSSREVVAGQIVAAGTEIGRAGTSGCAVGGPQLVLVVLRLTNLSGGRSYTFETNDGPDGFNGIQGAIDPFGWGGGGVDPWGYRCVIGGCVAPGSDPAIKAPGAFSINLWLGGQAPPTFL